MRTAEIARKTAETDIRLKLDIDGKGEGTISTGVGFLDHMLTLFSRHGRFDLSVSCKGDTWVDDHHSVEDIGIVLGQAFREALGDKKGIYRYGDIILPMDEALVLVSVDISGRGMLCYRADFRTEKIGTFDTQLVNDSWGSVSVKTAIPNESRLMSLYDKEYKTLDKTLSIGVYRVAEK